MGKQKVEAIIVSQEQIATDVYSTILKAEAVAKEAIPGQFVSVYTNDHSKLLPRPISLCEIDAEQGTLRLVYRVAGEGTKQFSMMHAGETLKILGPLGNGYTLHENKKTLLIAGGIGIPPMLQLAKQLTGETQIVLGYRDELFLTEDFEKYGTVYIASEDGKHGVKGNVMDAIKEYALSADVIYSCGPTPMLKAVKEFGLSNKIETQISLEEKMACGIGACLACVCKSKEVDDHSHVHNKRVCKDGPVFLAEEVEL